MLHGTMCSTQGEKSILSQGLVRDDFNVFKFPHEACLTWRVKAQGLV